MIYLFLGMLIGAIGTVIGNNIMNRGNLVLDDSDPSSPYLFLEITRGNMGDIMNSKYVIFKVSAQK